MFVIARRPSYRARTATGHFQLSASPQASVLEAGRTPSNAAIATLPRYTRDRALAGGEAAPLDQPGRASHRSGHDDAKALLQAHRHVISHGSRRTGDPNSLQAARTRSRFSCTAGWLAWPRNPIDTDMSSGPKRRFDGRPSSLLAGHRAGDIAAQFGSDLGRRVVSPRWSARRSCAAPRRCSS